MSAISLSVEATVPPDRSAAAAADAAGGGFGMLGPLALAASAGVVLAALAAVGSRQGDGWARTAFWAAVVLIAAPIAVRACGSRASRAERVGLVAVFTVALYLVKVVYDPTTFSFSDEYIHWRSTLNLLSTGHAFTYNPLLPVAGQYPGLPGLTAMLVQITGVPVPTAGLIVIGIARFVLMLSLFLLVESLSGSPRAASIACVVYAANPNFLYWDAQFGTIARARARLPRPVHRPPPLDRIGRQGRLAAGRGRDHRGRDHPSSLELHARRRARAVVRVRIGATPTPRGRRHLRSDRNGADRDRRLRPLGSARGAAHMELRHGHLQPCRARRDRRPDRSWRHADAVCHVGRCPVAAVGARCEYSAAAVLLVALAWAIRPALRRYRTVPLGAVLLLLAVLYPLVLPLRLVSAAQETSNRSSEYVFAGLGLVISTAVVLVLARRARRRATLLAAALTMLVIVGGVAVSWQYSEQLPVRASYRGVPNTVDFEAASAADWTRAALGTGNRFASDELDTLALATYGQQRTLWSDTDGASAWQIFLPATVTDQVVSAVRRSRVRYVLVQRRLSRGIPSGGVYYDKGEPGSANRRTPLPLSTLQKFDFATGVNRVFDNGDIQVYDVHRVVPRDDPARAAADGPRLGARRLAARTRHGSARDLLGLPWRIAIGLLATLVLPGYALAAAAFAPRRIRAADGLVLDARPEPRCRVPSAARDDHPRHPDHRGCLERARVRPHRGRSGCGRGAVRRGPRLRLPDRERLESGAGLTAMLVLAAAIATAGVVIARNGANDDHGPGFTELSLVPSGSGAAAVVKAMSFEHSATPFRLSVTPALPSLSSASFTLGPGRSWRDTVAIPESLRGYRIGITLYRAGDPKPYRFVFIGGPGAGVRRP